MLPIKVLNDNGLSFHLQELTYLSFSKHTDIGGGFRGVIVFPVCEDGAIQEGQIIAGWMIQLHLKENKNKGEKEISSHCGIWL